MGIVIVLIGLTLYVPMSVVFLMEGKK